VIPEAGYPAEPWHVRELGLDLTTLAQSESLFALSNGHIGARGNLDEGDPSGLPGTYLNSFYESRPLPYAEAGYGYPESGQTIVNVTNGKIIRLLVDDEPFDLRYGKLNHHERILDLRTGVLRRIVEWVSPAGQVVRVRSTRLVSFSQRAIMAIHYEVEAVGRPARIVLQSELVANEELPAASADPRVAAALGRPLEAEDHSATGNRSSLIHRTRLSGLRMAVAADHFVDAQATCSTNTYVQPDWSRTTVGTQLQPGQRVAVTKFVAYGWSSQRSLPALRDQVDAALSAAIYTGWEGIQEEQRLYLEEFWDGADVQLEGDRSMQQAVRFGLFHVLQAGARAEQRTIPAKGLTGPGYDGHAFWDTESFVLPVLSATAPEAAADALRWRCTTIDMAMERSKTLGRAGATFPWRTIRGQECGAYWPAGTAAVHVNSDVAVAAARHVNWTGDEEFDRDCALPILVQTARLWMSLGNYGADGEFHINGVTGPDEYSALVDDNTYTNLMAARNLSAAADTAQRWPADAAKCDVTTQEIDEWQHAAQTVSIPRDPLSGMPEQDRGFTSHARWDFEASARDNAYPLLLHSHYFEIYRKQVVKQADLILAMHWCGDSFTAEEKANAFAYYEPLTVRDSSLSACSQAVIAAEVGHLDLAYDYATEAALMDLRDLEHNTRDGVHIASLAGTWLAIVCGFGGMRDHGGRLTFAPRLPPALEKLSFTVRWRQTKVRIEVGPDKATYRLDDGTAASVELHHHGAPFTLTSAAPIVMEIPEITPLTPRPEQPVGRAPSVTS
jgi:alpha,alpha-trehalose phosphorylase